MIDIRKLKELVRIMVDNDLTELDLRDSEEQVTMRRPNPMAPPQMMAGTPMMHSMAAAPAMAAQVQLHPSVGNGAPAAAPSASDGDTGLIKIESPMVGTFYSAANPDSPPFVTVGTAIAPDKVICIIEAMKIFNEIKAECAGVIAKVMVKNGDAVEFGQPLFLVKPG
jgi:acetyl-CoA carboxylase biotin carboxyl carrier protein